MAVTVRTSNKLNVKQTTEIYNTLLTIVASIYVKRNKLYMFTLL